MFEFLISPVPTYAFLLMALLVVAGWVVMMVSLRDASKEIERLRYKEPFYLDYMQAPAKNYQLLELTDRIAKLESRTWQHKVMKWLRRMS